MARHSGLLVGLALSAIRGYQRHLSLHKGFCCAYRCATGRGSCSAHGYRVIERFGLWTGLALLRRRLRLCGETHRRRKQARNPVLHYQRGDCDIGCLPDLPCDDVGKGAKCMCDACECGSHCSDLRELWRDWRERRRLRRQERQRPSPDRR